MNMKIISFNIRNSNDPNGNTIAERAPRLFTITDPYNADIICLQECVPEWKKHILKHYRGQYRIYLRYRAKGQKKEGLALLWRKDRFRCIKKGRFWLSNTPEKPSLGWDDKYRCNRMCMYAILKDKVSGVTFCVINAHFGFGEIAQIKSAQLVTEYAKRICTCPVTVIGDFNMTSQTAGYAAMTSHFQDANMQTAQDSKSTYHGYHPETVRDSQIDFCFIDRYIEPKDFKIIDDNINGMFPSDHFGIYAELLIHSPP